MLYRLEVENFFSIRDRQVLDLTIDANVPDPDGRYAPIFPGSDVRAPKVVAFYGANASGKTTVLRALAFIIMMIRDSVTLAFKEFGSTAVFNDTESLNRPIRLAMEFGETVNVTPEVARMAERGEQLAYGTYRYELEIEVVNGLPTRILMEAMRQKVNGKGKWQRVFERDSNGEIKDSKYFSLSGYRQLLNYLAHNHTVLSSFAKFQHFQAQVWVKAAGAVITQVNPLDASHDKPLLSHLNGRPDVVSRLMEDLRRIDVGIEHMHFEETGDGLVPFFRHSGLQYNMPWILESHGTRSFVRLFPLLSAAFERGGVAVIDELDAAIHPNMLAELVRWFYADSGRNPKNGQLWFSCHSASLLEDLNKEEIVICEKDRQGRTSVFSLMDVKVRRDENHYRKYLSGAYGGVPHLG